MTNLSSLSKAIILQFVALTLVAVDAVIDMIFCNQITIYGVVCLVSVIVTACIAIYFQLDVQRSIKRYMKVMDELTHGDYECRIIHIREKGILRDLAQSINRMTDVADAFVREAGNSMAAVSEGRYSRKVIEVGLPGIFRRGAVVMNLAIHETDARIKQFRLCAVDFEKNVKDVVLGLADASDNLQQSAETMKGAADVTSKQSGAVSVAAGQAAHNVETVASAAEELSASIAEIDRRVLQSASMTTKAREEALHTDELVQSLSQAAQKIGAVVQLIRDIAEQTNLLALNATIEAARAGEAGKGFAVVANEVKSLANQTAKATGEISEQVGSMQDATEKAVAAVRHIGETISEINQVSASITTSVEEQRAATQEIARNVQQASSSTVEVSSNIAYVSNAATDTQTASAQVLVAAKKLGGQSGVLKNEVEKFLESVRKV